ncbi:PH domain-containing protein [Natronorarus salvus]|uniref:PH domain-containing protein n=1 Tax=Natronorarus salvus TaxID=3117733 RepID=UPI002F26C067
MTGTKLHPVSIPYRVVQGGIGLLPLVIFGGIFAAPVVGGLSLVLLPVAVVVVVGLLIAWQVAYYRRFEYELTPDTFDIRSGVISRRNREIPYARIQNIDISRNVVQRALDVAEVRIETAGGSQTEAMLRYVAYEEAKRLQNDLRRQKRDAEAAVGEPEEERPERALYEITPNDLLVLAVASFDLRLASAVFVLLSFAAPGVLVDVVAGLPISPIVVVAVGLALVVVGSALLSGVGAVFNTYGFRLTQAGDELRYERGLIQRFDGTIPLDKVQTLAFRENLLKRLFGYSTLAIETAGYAPGRGDANVGSEAAVPIARRERAWGIGREIEAFPDVELERPPKRARHRYVVRYLIGFTLLGGALFTAEFVTGVETYWYAAAVGLLVAPFAGHYKWKARGYRAAAGYVLTRNGFWRQTTRIVPYYRVQNVIETQTLFQRRWRLATVTVDTAGTGSLIGGDSQAVDLDREAAERFRGTIGERLQEALIERAREKRREREARERRRAMRERPLWDPDAAALAADRTSVSGSENGEGRATDEGAFDWVGESGPDPPPPDRTGAECRGPNGSNEPVDGEGETDPDAPTTGDDTDDGGGENVGRTDRRTDDVDGEREGDEGETEEEPR